MTFGFSILGARQAIARLDNLQGQATRAIVPGMQAGVQAGVGIVRGRSSGRPGPRAVTGDHRRQISGDVAVTSPTMVEGQIGSNDAQGLRLELGFSGPDALGRVYNQPPYPAFGPSEAEVEAAAYREISAAVGGALR